MKPKLLKFTLYLPPDIHSDVKAEAQEQSRKEGYTISMTNLICRILKRRYRRKKKVEYFDE